MYGVRAPTFFEGNDRAFTDLCFHLEEERFAFYQPIKMRDDPMWIDVTELLQKGVGTMIQKFTKHPDYRERLDEILPCLNRVDGIKEIDLHIEEVIGEDKTSDVVVDIFNRVN